jgi:hypothetical protein
MGFTSYDDLINQVTTNNKIWVQPWNRISPTAMTAGRWYDLFLGSSDRGQGYHGNYVKNWGFDSAADWTGVGAGGWAWNVAGTMVHTAGTAGSLTQTPLATIEASTTYTVIVTTSGPVGSGGITIDIGGTASASITTATTSTLAVTTGASPTQQIAITANSLQTMTVDNLIVISGGINGQSPRFMPYDANMQGNIWPGDLTGGTATKHLLTMSAQTAGATTVPITLLLVDILGCYARIDGNLGTAITLANSLTLPRYTTGAGVMAYSVVAPATTGATAHNVQITYTNQSNVGSRSLPQTVAATASALNSHIYHSGTAANNVGPFLPLQTADTGIRSVQTWLQSAANGTASTFTNLVLCKPIMELQLTTQFLLAERDMLNQFPSLPLIQQSGAASNACLSWIAYAGAATPGNTNFFGVNRYCWGG